MNSRHFAKHRAIERPVPPWSGLNSRPCRITPRHWRDWLFDPGSLTARLVEHDGRPFKVVPRCQGFRRSSVEEAVLLGNHSAVSVWFRNVQLRLGDEVVVEAETVIPTAQLRALGFPIRQLGNRSLGSFLFRQPGLRRASLIARHNRHHQGNRMPWLRRSRFVIKSTSILVTERFSSRLTGGHP